MEDYLFFVHHAHGVQIHSFVLMNNHFHLLISAPRGNISAALLYFMRESSREISRLTGRMNHTWGARNHKTVIPTFHQFMNVYKYVYYNPVRAGICGAAEAYTYSTLSGLCGAGKMNIPLAEDTILFNPTFDGRALEWINRQPKIEHLEEVGKALRKPVFQLSTPRKAQRPSFLENSLL
jgi:REP element-mobilizing transposase RayT